MATLNEKHERHSTSRRGWTLVELLIVIAIVAVLLGLTLAAVQQARGAAARLKCASNLHQLAMAVHLYADAHQHFPAGCDYPFATPPDPVGWHIGLSWHTSILPYVEQDALWARAWEANRQDPFGHSAAHNALRETTVALYLCPTESRQSGTFDNTWSWGLTSYRGVAGTGLRFNDGIFHPNYRVRFAGITDGTSTTVMIGERPPGPRGIWGGWYAAWGESVCVLGQLQVGAPNTTVPSEGVGCRLGQSPLRPGRIDDACDLTHFWSLHANGANFAFADGSVRFLAYGQSDILPALATRAEGEVVSTD